ncbi:MAG: GAF domain-containing protein [Methanomassiliicoccales archaeon]
MPPPPISILVVDDEHDMCDLSQLFLSKNNDMKVHTVSSVEDARRALAEGHFDAIISDYQMPREDGIQFLKWLRAKGDMIPFILFTGKGREEVVIEALNNGADSYLQKGGKPEPLYTELAHRTRMAVHKRQADIAIDQRNIDLQRANEELAAVEEELRAQLDEILSGERARALAEAKAWAAETQKQSMFQGMLSGAAIQEIICDENGKPIDYRFLDVNPAFEELTGLRRETAVGRTVREVIPLIEDEWIERYGKVALSGVPDHFENFAAGLGKYYQVTAYQNAPGQFTTIFSDVSQYVKHGMVIKTRLEMSEFSVKGNLDDLLRRTLDEVEKITASSIGFLHFVDDDQEHLHLQMWSTNTISKMCSAEGKGQHYAISKAGVWVDCMRLRVPVIHNDVAGLDHRKGFPPGHPPVKRELVVPVMRGGKIKAVLGVGNKATDYDLEDVATVRQLADLIWDIAERKRLEEEIIHSRENLRQALDGSGIGIWEYEVSIKKLNLSGEWIVSTSNANAGLLRPGKSDTTRLIHPDDQKAAREMLELCLNGKREVFECELRLMHREGHWRWLLARGRITSRDSQGRPSLLMGTFVDINERKNSEKEVHDSEEKFRAISHSSPDHIIMQDTMLRYVWVLNPQLGMSEADMIGKTDYEILPAEDAERLIRAKSKVLESGQRTHFTTSLVSREGNKEYFEGDYIPQFDSCGKASGLIGYFRNVTEVVKAQEAGRLTNRKLNLLSSITRHDIINQLLLLEGNLILIEDDLKNASSFENLKKAEAAARRISAMIRFTKEYEDIGVISPTWQNVHAMVATCTQHINLGQIRLINEIPRNLEVFADPLIAKVFRNLVDNAVKHGADLTTIRFSSESTQGNTVIVCTDDGVGISEETRKYIFNRGYGRDHGLGLYLSREILAITGIEISERDPPGRGAQFVLVVPPDVWRKGKS